MNNPGLYPIDPTSEVGKLRISIGDTAPEVIESGESGEAGYDYFSDAELAVIISDSGDIYSKHALANAYFKLSAQATSRSGIFKTYDLNVDLTTRAAAWRQLAEDILAQAKAEDAANGVDEDMATWTLGLDAGQALFPEALPHNNRGF